MKIATTHAVGATRHSQKNNGGHALCSAVCFVHRKAASVRARRTSGLVSMKVPVIVAGVALACGSARAASFDCTKAARPVEKVICGNGKLNAADDDMGRVYRQTLGRLPTSNFGLLRADQVQWLSWAQEVCRANEAVPATTVANCMLPLYADRSKRLRVAVAQRGSVLFLTRTQYLAQPEEKGSDSAPPGDFPGYGTLQASWPMALSSDAAWIAWNKAVETRVLLTAGAGENDDSRQTPLQAAVWSGKLAEAQDTQVDARVRSVEHGRTTSTVSSETMGHPAAHPSESSETFTWLLTERRALQPGDVFATASAWQTAVAAACWKALSTGEQKQWLYPEVNGPTAKPLLQVITDVHNWTLEADALHISYPEYSVAPRVSPVDDTVIPWVKLKSVLATGFTQP